MLHMCVPSRYVSLEVHVGIMRSMGEASPLSWSAAAESCH